MHEAYPDGDVVSAADIEAGDLDSGYGNLTPVGGEADRGAAAAGAFATEALEVIGRVGAQASIMASARASSLAPPWIVRLRPGAKAGCRTTYLLFLHLVALRCVI